MKPYSEACERNKAVIFTQLNHYIGTDDNAVQNEQKILLEIGSGSGQHAAHCCQQFARAGQRLCWQPSDVDENLAGIERWRIESGCDNFLPPMVLDLHAANSVTGSYDYVYTANTLHIVSWNLVLRLFEIAGQALKPYGKLFIYGPFNYHGGYTSGSNREFDDWLQSRDELSGIRDFEHVVAAASQLDQPLRLLEDIAMPANNRFLVFEKMTM